jgi:hypothetical protein
VMVEGAIRVAGDSEDPFLARMIDVQASSAATKVHQAVVPGDPEE